MSSPAPQDISQPPVPVTPEPLVARARFHWRSWIREIFASREGQLFLFLAVLIGVFSGLAVVCFRVAIEWVQFVLLGSSMSPGPLRVVLVPAITGLFVAVLAIRVFPRTQGSGVNQTKAAVYVSNGYVPFDTVIGKFITCALAIGSGQSLGPEDPSLQMGAGIASAMGRSLKLSQSRIRLIAPVGAAAGLAAAFNAPIAAVLFVIEEVIGTWSAGVLGAIILAAVSSVVTMRWFLGPESLFRVPPVRIDHPAEFLGFAVLGVAGGAASLVFSKWIQYARPRVLALPRWTHYLLPSAAGLAIGIIGIWMPQVMGAGYAVMDQALHAQFTWKLLLVLAVLKIVATGFSFLSGTPGGMFAPTLFIGAMLGGGIGAIEHHFFPSLTVSVGTFALVGMGTMFGGFLRVPITSIFMVIEVSGNYTVALPVMVSSLIAYLISRQYQTIALFDMLSRQDGLILPSVEERREQTAMTVEDAMQLDNVVIVQAGERISDVLARTAQTKQAYLLLRAGVGDWRLLDREEIERQVCEPDSNRTIAAVQSKGPLPMLFPDESLEEALRWVSDWPVIPVVSRPDLGRLAGILTLQGVLRAVQKAAVN